LGPNSKVVVQSSFPTGSGWETQFQNNDSSSEKVDAMVICTAYPGP
jgi:hypothetical protein